MLQKTTDKSLQIAFLLLTFFVSAAFLALAISSDTTTGLLIGLTGLLFCFLPLSVIFKLGNKSTITALSIATTSGLFVICSAGAGVSATDSSVQSIFLKTTESYNSYSISHIVPEEDQLLLGSNLFSIIDPLYDKTQAQRLSSAIRKIYREMNQSNDFKQLGSQLGSAYSEMLGLSFDTGHVYIYRPQSIARETKTPVILFLHGSLGNFKGYLWVWKQFADKNGFTILAPSFGAGNWQRAGGIQAVERAWNFILKDDSLDHSRVILAGLSNGGIGVGLESLKEPERYVGLALFSPVMQEQVFYSNNFISGWKDKPIFIISGDKDPRIPITMVKQFADFLSSSGVGCTLKIFPGEDHSLFFTNRMKAMEYFESWLTSIKI